MLNRLIIFLIRKRLGLKKYQMFYFKNQANKQIRYGFYDDYLVRADINGLKTRESHINLNFLLSEEVKRLIVKC